MNHGLFQKAIMQSGAGLGYFNARQDTLEHAQANGIRLFEALGVSTLEQARAIPARTVLEAAESLPVPPDSGREDDWSMIVNWVPCVDGLFLPDQEERIVESCKANNVDMLVGNTTNEFIASTEDGKPCACRPARQSHVDPQMDRKRWDRAILLSFRCRYAGG